MDENKLVIFDMDGTLFRTETVDVKAINEALIKNGFNTKTEAEILSVFGLKLKEVFQILASSSDDDIFEKFKQDIIEFEKLYIDEYGKLYDGVIESLENLKCNGYRLCICSNGGREYIMSIVEKFGIDKYFDDIKYSVDGISKSQAVRMIKEKFNAEKFIMVGDRTSDIEAAGDNKGVSIGVTYGFGKNEVEKADYIASNLFQVKSIIESIF